MVVAKAAAGSGGRQVDHAGDSEWITNLTLSCLTSSAVVEAQVLEMAGFATCSSGRCRCRCVAAEMRRRQVSVPGVAAGGVDCSGAFNGERVLACVQV